MEQSEYILIGGGEHARVVLDILLSSQARVNALFDPKYSGKLFGIDQLGEYQSNLFQQSLAIVAIGNNTSRKKASESVTHKFGKLVHASVHVSQFSTIGEGSVLFHNSIIQTNAQVGRHVIINTGAQVDHDCVLEDFVHIAPGAILCGSVQIGEGTLIGAGAVIIPGVKVGRWSVIGAGAVVTQPVPDFSVGVGMPARVVRTITT